MIVPFPFTFKLTVPGITNPFADSPESSDAPSESETASVNSLQVQSEPIASPVRRPRQRLPSTNRPRPTSPPAPITRKRAWEPSFAEPSRSSATLASTSGYLDTPAKYREMVGDSGSIDNDSDIHEDELPPPTKRRRGLAGSIVSTAVSAALIGTAVGLTVYRLCVHASSQLCRILMIPPTLCSFCDDGCVYGDALSSRRWRDRGKLLPLQPVQQDQEQEQEQIPPPPPYEQGEWNPEASSVAPSVKVTPSTPARGSRRPRAAVQASAKRSSTAVFPPACPEFDFTPDQEEDPEIDQMDWIGDKLAQLIEEGKRALKSEVVVMSEAKEDEVDDGTGAWEEENPAPVSSSPVKSISRSSSVRSKRRNTHIPIASPYSLSGSPRKSAFDLSLPSSSSSAIPVPVTPAHQRGRSMDLPLGGGSFREDGSAWESPELRESMEKARARFLASRNGGV
ncbi:hypothetical protein BDQ17DRAFT_1431475 [Cyathus striatus]|nr:hypothetical protein BDQ17DRAFT_1431475 [Cyathus striatus]